MERFTTLIAPQVLKTHETSAAFTDHVPAHEFCMTGSMPYMVKSRSDKYLMALALRADAIGWDSCDFLPTTAVTGAAAHVTHFAAVYVAVGRLIRYLSPTRTHHQQEHLLGADITTGLLWHRGG